MVTIRRMRTGDVEACTAIVAGDPLWQRYGLTPPRARRAFRWALAQTQRGGAAARAAGEVAVAVEGSRVVGFIWFRLDGTFHHSGYVRWIGVEAQARRMGVGRRLMRYAEERILRSGPNVFLLVSDFNRRAQTFYRRQGYTRIGAIPGYVVPGITEYLFRKTRGPVAARSRQGARTRGDATA
jgi:ribosomal protein S18 acetylase RimI-like enzyme